MMEQDLPVFGIQVQIPLGSRAVIIALTFVAMLLWRSGGVTNGKEFTIPKLKRKTRR
jgi:hypothetical protein